VGSVEDSRFTGWTAAAGVPDSIAGLRFDLSAGGLPCLSDMDPAPIGLDNMNGGVTAMIALDLETVLIGRYDGSLAKVQKTTTTRLDALSATVGYSAAYRAPSGEVWLGRADGWLVELDPGLTTILRRVPPFDGSREIVDLAGPRTASAAFELFAVTPDDEFARFDGTSWRVLEPPDPTHGNFAHVVWIGPEDGIAAGRFVETVLHYRAGTVVAEPVDGLVMPQLKGVTAAAFVPPYGAVLVAETEDGHQRKLFQFDPAIAHWTSFLTTGVATSNIYDLCSFQNGLAFTGQAGELGAYFPGRSCPLPPIVSGEFWHVAALGLHQLVIAGAGEFGQDKSVAMYWLSR
jgi:hypothetical protein